MNQMSNLGGGLGGQSSGTGMGGGVQTNSGLGGFYSGNADPFAEIDNKPGQYGATQQNTYGQQQ